MFFSKFVKIDFSKNIKKMFLQFKKIIQIKNWKITKNLLFVIF